MQFKGIKNDFKKRVKYTRLNLSVHYYKYATSVFPKIDSYKKKNEFENTQAVKEV